MDYLLEVHKKKPNNFTANVEVAATHVRYNEKMLLLKRGPNQPEGNTWCVPGGKVEDREPPVRAAIRELFEETSISISRPSFEKFGKLYIKKPHVSFICHLFEVCLNTPPEISLSPEHTDFRWATADEVNNLPLISGASEMLLIYYQFIANKK